MIPETLFWLVLVISFLGPPGTYLLFRREPWALLLWSFLPLAAFLFAVIFNSREVAFLALYSAYSLMAGCFLGMFMISLGGLRNLRA